MSDRELLLGSIAETIHDYRQGHIAEPTLDHVDRWIRQFDEEVQLPLLREVAHTLNRTYITRENALDFLRGLLSNESLAGTDPALFWRSVNFLKIQQYGHSQQELLGIFDALLQETFGFGIAECRSETGPYIYLDDVLFSGDRASSDLTAWIADAPEQAQVHVIVMAFHRFGQWSCHKKLKELASEKSKKIDFQFWRLFEIENRKTYKDSSEILWPAILPDDPELANYINSPAFGKVAHVPRMAGPAPAEIFSSEEGRQLLEREFLRAGIRIRGFCAQPRNKLRPLGYGPFGLGFGALTVSFRNCPNNCPLAFWWGDPMMPQRHPLSRWYPLLPRQAYGAGDF